MSDKLDLKNKPTQPVIYQIRVKGLLGSEWADWFGGLTITQDSNNDTLLTGPVVDQAALYGVLRKVRDAGLPLLSINHVEPDQADEPGVKPSNNDIYSYRLEKERTMNSVSKPSRILGAAFLFQFVTSFTAGVFLLSALVVDGDIVETMLRVSGNPALMRTTILVDMLTVLGVTFLGVVLYTTLRKQNENMALTGLGFYILEAVLLAASRGSAFSLLRISQEWAITGHPELLQTMANLSAETMHFVGGTLMMVAFCPGAILFYYLLDRSRIVPRVLSLWGLITVFPCLAGTMLSLFGIEVPFLIYVPYVPFEFVIGLWILIKGIRVEEGAS